MHDINALLEPLYEGYPEASGAPLIGITTNGPDEDHVLRHVYTEQVIRAGGVPVLVTPDMGFQAAAQLLESLDGLLLSGGGDINPLWAGEEPEAGVGGIYPARDRFELGLIRLAYTRTVPMLGICRGCQALATALGGHVRQNISSPIRHRQDAPKSETTHTVSLVEGTALAAAYGGFSKLGKALEVNSFHHQAVDKAGPLLRVAATAPDGTIEGVESSAFRPVLGVQWHPEQLGEGGQPVFRWLIREAATMKRAKALHRRHVTLDSHSDTPMLFPQGIDFLRRGRKALYDLHRMDEGRLDAVQMVCYLPQPKLGERFSDIAPIHGVGGAAAYCEAVFTKIEEIAARAPERLSIARTASEIWRDKRAGRHSIVLGIENGLALEGDVRNVARWRERGVTYITLCHNGDNDLCDSAKGCATHGGLSRLGRDVVREMNRCGVMVDLSHASETTFWQALRLSEQPVVCSHSSCRALCEHPRNLTDEQMRALAEKGGVMQVTAYAGFLSPQPGATIETFVSHVLHAVKIMGIEHVGIGTDFDGDGGVPGLDDASAMLNLTRHLMLSGLTEGDISKLWGQNWLRVMAQVQAV